MSNESAAVLEERKHRRIWAILAVLPLISLAAQQTGLRSLAIFTSILVVLASTWIATTTWMHVNLEPKYITYLCVLGVATLAMFFFMVAPDVMNHEGNQWTNPSANHPAEIDRGPKPIDSYVDAPAGHEGH